MIYALRNSLSGALLVAVLTPSTRTASRGGPTRANAPVLTVDSISTQFTMNGSEADELEETKELNFYLYVD